MGLKEFRSDEVVEIELLWDDEKEGAGKGKNEIRALPLFHFKSPAIKALGLIMARKPASMFRYHSRTRKHKT